MPVADDYAGTCEDDASVGTATWASVPSGTGAPDSVNSSVTLLNSQSHYFVGRNFGLSIPSGAVITNVAVAVWRSCSGQAKDVVVKLWHSSAVIGDNLADLVSDWGTSGPQNIVYDDGNNWGATITPSMVNDASFGVAISVENTDGSGSIPAIDAIRLSITYTVADDTPAPALQDSLGLLTSRRLVARRSPQISSIGADDAIIFADQPSETPLCGPGLLDSRPRRAKQAKPSYAGGFADNLTDELASLDSPSTLLFASPRPTVKRTSASSIVTNSPPPDESHPCGCVGTARVVSYGFATAKFVGASDVANVGGTFSAKMIETGYTASLVDACDCEE